MLYDNEGVPRIVQSVRASHDSPNNFLVMFLFNGTTHNVGITDLQAVPSLAGRSVARLLSAEDLQPLYEALDRLAFDWFFSGDARPRPNQYQALGERLKSISNA